MPRWNTYPENLTPATTEHVALVDTDTRTTLAAIGTALGLSAGATNLTWAASTSTVASDTGTDAVITAVDATNPGLMTVAQRASLLIAPEIESGGGTPASTPAKVGDIYIDVTSDVPYMATGSASSADWTSLTPATITQHHYDTVTFPDTVAQADTASAWRCPTTGTLVEAIIWCDTAPATTTIILDLLKNGTTVFTGGTQRPVIAVSGTDDVSGAPSLTSMAAADLFQWSVTQLNATDQGNIGQLFGMIHWTEDVTV